MTVVQLETDGGDFVTYATIPFIQSDQPMPRVLIWGSRVFRWANDWHGPDQVPIYLEAFAIVVVDKNTPRNKP